MLPTPPEPPAAMRIRHRPWPTPPRRPRMANAEDTRQGLALCDRYLIRAGRPWLPISGELQYSRVPRHRWAERLRLMRSGGVTVAASYVPWLHHVPHRGAPRFDGNLDLAAFVDGCHATGLEVVLRIGPWVHGEIRNGGLPDWVRDAPVTHRSDDPAYLDLVREWFGQLGAALDGRCTPAGVLAIQLENEFHGHPDHLLTLKRLARAAGMSAPLWTATAWDDTPLPAGDAVLPVYGGYGDGFWVPPDAGWEPTFRRYFFFSHRWDDTVPPRRSAFPPVTCELGCGMATAYHRRPRPAALDIAAVANGKLGSGSAWQGYYLYTGGTNPPGEHGTQESHATGYPNDLPRFDYDFHAPIGAAGTLAPSHAELRRQHAFLAAFGPALADMPSALPEQVPTGVEDTTTLRWALRSDGRSGFVFLSWHQPHVPLGTYRQAQLRVALAGEEITLPAAPVDIPAGTLARWPVALDCGGVRLDWATASVLTVLPGPVPTLVLTAEAGIPVDLAPGPGVAVDDAAPTGDPGHRADPAPTGDGGHRAGPAPTGGHGHGDAARSAAGGVYRAAPGRVPLRLRCADRVLDVLVLPAEDAGLVWVVEPAVDGSGRRLLLSALDLAWGPDGRVTTLSPTGDPDVRAYDPGTRRFHRLRLATPTSTPAAPAPAGAVEVPVCQRRQAGEVPAGYGQREHRPSAPAPATVDELAAVYQLHLPGWAADPGNDPLLHLDWAGDLAELRVDGRTVADRFWDGSRWTVSLRDIGYRQGAVLTLHLLPLAADSPVHLPADAAARRPADVALLALDAVRVVARTTWVEAAAAPVTAPPRAAATDQLQPPRATAIDPPQPPPL